MAVRRDFAKIVMAVPMTKTTTKIISYERIGAVFWKENVKAFFTNKEPMTIAAMLLNI
ncbi:hypothetical protein D3C79_1076400 [compost metagenome]